MKSTKKAPKDINGTEHGDAAYRQTMTVKNFKDLLDLVPDDLLIDSETLTMIEFFEAVDSNITPTEGSV